MDATDRLRVEDCRQELAGLLLEEVRVLVRCESHQFSDRAERLMGASLLVLLNKTDVAGCMGEEEARQVSACMASPLRKLTGTGTGIGRHQDARLEHISMQCNDW